jgi:uncharacterized membrane protein YuzA (DUF378 family)
MVLIIKEFLKPTKSKIIATILIIVFLVINQSFAVQSWPRETLSWKIQTIVFTPASLIKKAILGILSVDLRRSFFGPIAFILNIATYYLLGCSAAYMMKAYKKIAIKK